MTVQGPAKKQQPDGMSHRGSPKGLVHHLLMLFFAPGSSKIEVFETYLFDSMIT